MTSVLTRDDLIKNGSVQMDAYRVRLVEAKDVPVLKSLECLVGKEVVLFDRPVAADLEKENLELRLQVLTTTPNKTLQSEVSEEDSEVASSDGDTSSRELLSPVWTLSSLERMAGIREAFEALASSTREEETPTLDLHLCPSKEAFSFDYLTVSQNRELLEGGYFFMTDASGPLRMLLRGHMKRDNKLTSFMARSLGTLKDSTNKLELISLELGTNAQLIGLKYRSRYDMLPPAVSQVGYNDFIPAQFYVDSEWSVRAPKEKPRKPKELKPAHIPDFFCKPVPQTIAKITFRTGWLDPRLANHTRSLELKFLLTLCDFLENRECVWPETQEQPEIVERVVFLVNEGRNQKESGNRDFTERLWEELRHCRSHATASRAFDLVFEQIRTGTFRVPVRADNKSSLSWMLRTHGSATETMRCLEPLYCAHLLVELGLDRVKRDIYEGFITGGLLHTTGDLDEMLQNARQIEERVQALVVMHLAQQSLLTIRRCMDYERTDLSRLGGRLLAHFKLAPLGEKFRTEFTFEAPISFFALEALRPINIHEWSVERTWAGNDGEIPGSEVDLILLSVRPLFEHIAPYRVKSKKAEVADASARWYMLPVSEKADPQAHHCIHVLADSTMLINA